MLFFCLDEEIYGSLLKEAKDSVENEKSSEGLLKDEMPPEDDYIPTVSLSVFITHSTFLCIAFTGNVS